MVSFSFILYKKNIYLQLICRGSKIVIEGENLDSVYRTIIRFKPNESHLKPVTRVQCLLSFRTITLLLSLQILDHLILFKGHIPRFSYMGLESMYNHSVFLQECIGKSLPTRMECISPVFPRDETEEGELSFDMDGALGLWNKEFSYHPYGKPIPFETEGHVLSLYPGFDEVSLHVRDTCEDICF